LDAEPTITLARLRDVLQDLVAACDQPHGASRPIIEQLEREIAWATAAPPLLVAVLRFDTILS